MLQNRSSSEWREYLEPIEQELRLLVDASEPTPLAGKAGPSLKTMLSYHLGWMDPNGREVSAIQGKRLRPLLCLWSCEAAGGNWRKALPAAVAIELVHNFSLIHDDIEDQSVERRGRPTLWKLWGMAQAINAGDAMFVLARLSLDKLQAVVAPAAYSDVHDAFDASTLALTQGQFLDLSLESLDLASVEDYMEMVRGKTAALLSVAAEIGSRIGTDSTRVVESFARFGENIGVAFQIVDDVLGIWGDPRITGKAVGDDLLSKKKSLPIVAALQADSDGRLASALQGLGDSQPDVRPIIEMLSQANARQAAEAMAEEYLARALKALEDGRLEGEAVQRLKELAFAAVNRES